MRAGLSRASLEKGSARDRTQSGNCQEFPIAAFEGTCIALCTLRVWLAAKTYLALLLVSRWCSKRDFGKLWAGISYRRSFDGAEFLNGTGVSSQKLQYFTPLLGVNYNDFVFAYTYSYQANSIVFNNGGFHQLTLGYNFNCVKEKYECNCPSVN